MKFQFKDYMLNVIRHIKTIGIHYLKQLIEMKKDRAGKIHFANKQFYFSPQN